MRGYRAQWRGYRAKWRVYRAARTVARTRVPEREDHPRAPHGLRAPAMIDTFSLIVIGLITKRLNASTNDLSLLKDASTQQNTRG